MSDRLRGILRVLAPSSALVAFLLLGLFVGQYQRYVLSHAAAAIVIGAALTMLVGYARCISLATGAMMALGAYGSTLLVIKLGFPFLLAVALGGVLGGLGGFILAVPGVRFRSHNLAMVTLVFQSVVIIVIRELKGLTGGAEGLNVPRPTLFGIDFSGDYAILMLTVCVCVCVLVPLTILVTGAYGKNLRALASNEVGARAFGISIEHHLIAAFTISSAAVAIAAAIAAPRFRVIDPDTYGIMASIFTLAYPIVGGMQSIWGGVLGGGVLALLPEVLRPVADFIELFFAVLVIATIMFFRGGLVDLAGAIGRRLKGARPPESIEAASPVDAAVTGGLETSNAAVAAIGNALVIDNVSKVYDALRAVDGVSVEVRAGSLHGLMGPNGAGKTTLFNTISGFVGADGGRIECFGRDITHSPVEGRIALGITRTFQQVAIFPELTCRDNVVIGLGRNGIGSVLSRSFDDIAGRARAAEERGQADWALAAVGLGGLGDAPAGMLSLGNQRRLEIARAIVSRPRLILLDEPVSGVGHQEAEQLKDLLKRINADLGVTMLVVEHNIGFLVSLCDQLTVMGSGRVIAEGKPEEVVTRSEVRRVYFGESEKVALHA